MDFLSGIDWVALMKAVVAAVTIFGPLLIIKRLSKNIGTAVKEDELGQTRQGEPE